MVFSSAVFLFFFLPAVLVLSRLIPGTRGKNILLALGSLVFYAFGQLRYVPLFVLSITLNYLAGLALQHGRLRKGVLVLAVAANLLILGLYKYTDFILENLNLAFGAAFPMTGIVLPIGISFFTFQGMSYVIDVYRDPASGTRRFGEVFLYISFFPQLIAGPIVKYHDVAEQIRARRGTVEDLAAGLRRFIAGLAKKLLIANSLGAVADAVFNNSFPRYGAAGDFRLAWLGALCYMLQIYYDFSGYSDMAIGLGRAFGFRFLENFRHPYAACGMRDFWTRWHISLSAWFREYLYIPLGGNRRGKARAALNRLVVFFCTGIWHGANWTFLLWGLSHGLLSSLEGAGLIPVERLRRRWPGRLLLRAYTLLAVMLLFVLFRADSVGAALRLMGAMFAFRAAPAGAALLARLLTPAVCLVLLAAIALAGRLPEALARRFAGFAEAHETAGELVLNLGALLLFALSLLSLSQGGFNPFIYFQF